MFRIKCARCGKKIKEKFEFCPYCGTRVEDSSNYGFLGKEDFIGPDEIRLPMGFNFLLRPLMKELIRQMQNLDKELREEEKALGGKSKPNETFSSFSIHIGIPGQKPIKLESFSDGKRIQIKDFNSSGKNVRKIILPKIDISKIEDAKDFPRKEAIAEMKRVDDKIIYNIFLPGVKSLSDINIAVFENVVEIKAISDKEVLFKNLKLKLPILDYSFSNEKLTIEFSTN
ncbi:MAG: zinc ribbon domain-containing protein [Candidatus Pacearchaeota archaeon]